MVPTPLELKRAVELSEISGADAAGLVSQLCNMLRERDREVDSILRRLAALEERNP
jgi:hypothetical protein